MTHRLGPPLRISHSLGAQFQLVTKAHAQIHCFLISTMVLTKYYINNIMYTHYKLLLAAIYL